MKSLSFFFLQIILLGDSAVGKSKLIERFLLQHYLPHQLSTYALTLYRHTVPHPQKPNQNLTIEFWDTAGQERFQSMHTSYYYQSHCCILCFDLTRKVTYKNLDRWYEELLQHRGMGMPVVVVANKVDADPSRAKKAYGFIDRRRKERGGREEDFPLFFCSASDGTNVVAAFREAIKRAAFYKEHGATGGGENFADEVLKFIEDEERQGGIFSGKDEDEKIISIPAH
ncbi:P-loop containing nucleoside triphosphate hydrolase protein [Cladochytrium replicatum]|nr:P-loop containing nucleoside triphosphate hydrolase protein [Cladochytrium replicatum]